MRFKTQAELDAHIALGSKNWPSNVRGISIGELDLFGIDDDTEELYWRGKKLLVKKTIALKGGALWAAWVAALGALASGLHDQKENIALLYSQCSHLIETTIGLIL